MKIICKWIFKENIQGIKTPQLKAKQKDVSNTSAEELLEMIITLLAQNETVRLIFEKENKQNEQSHNSSNQG